MGGEQADDVVVERAEEALVELGRSLGQDRGDERVGLRGRRSSSALNVVAVQVEAMGHPRERRGLGRASRRAPGVRLRGGGEEPVEVRLELGVLGLQGRDAPVTRGDDPSRRSISVAISPRLASSEAMRASAVSRASERRTSSKSDLAEPSPEGMASTRSSSFRRAPTSRRRWSVDLALGPRLEAVAEGAVPVDDLDHALTSPRPSR